MYVGVIVGGWMGMFIFVCTVHKRTFIHAFTIHKSKREEKKWEKNGKNPCLIQQKKRLKTKYQKGKGKNYCMRKEYTIRKIAKSITVICTYIV